ncbi:MAG: hypothetical protein H6772_01810 [Pseudomonadales bacterium]|nr:hypothetical protein [Pseudomonadales bacterium]
MPILSEKRTVALIDKPNKIVLKIFKLNGKEVSVFDYVSDQSEISNYPLSSQSFFVTDEEEKLIGLLEITF